MEFYSLPFIFDYLSAAVLFLTDSCNFDRTLHTYYLYDTVEVIIADVIGCCV